MRQTPEDVVLAAERTAVIEGLIDTLTVREARVLRMRYGAGMTLRQIGAAIGTSRTRPQQLEEKALRKLRHPSRMNRHDLAYLRDEVRTRHARAHRNLYVPVWKRDEIEAIEHAAWDAAWDEAHALNDAQDMRRAARYAREQGEQHYREWCARQDAELARLAGVRAARARYIAELFTANEARRHAEYVAELYAVLGPRPRMHHAQTDQA